MNKSKVYFTDMHTHDGYSLLDKLEKLITKAGIGEIDFNKRFAVIKIHFGEPGNLSHLRPNFARLVVDKVKNLGGIPFLCDCNTLYTGRRKNAIEHIESAAENGFNLYSCGCPIIIGDGLKGTDDVEVPVEGGEYFKTARIGRAIMDADIFISLAHFKGHEATGFGGAIKNTGMGCGSRAGKMAMHNDGKPVVDQDKCVNCKKCAKECAQNAISFDTGKAYINHDKCVGCGRCIGACNFDSIYNATEGAFDVLNRKIAEYAKAVTDKRPCFFINIVNNVSPFCDCHGQNDLAIIPDVGLFASFDPVALDVACADACNNMPVIEGSRLSKQLEEFGNKGDHFHNCFHETNWRSTFEHAEKLGMGTQKYELITIK
ncbi:MAG: DUF362 domain-containing protein [Christensenellaceae bacterium]|nr:DUF362 domain-containing protein [Christensenellaceae bacterium]